MTGNDCAGTRQQQASATLMVNKMVKPIERRSSAARGHPMRRAGDPRYDAGFVAHLVAASLQVKEGRMLRDVAQQFAGLAYWKRNIATQHGNTRAPTSRWTA